MMKNKKSPIEFAKMLAFIMKRLCVVVLCAELGLWGIYLYTMNFLQDTYTASGTMYVNNESEYKDSEGGDLDSTSRLIKTYLVVVPTSFNSVTEEEFKKRGVNIVIYANQLMRAEVPAIQETARSILEHHRALEVDSTLMPFKDIIRMIPEEG